MLRAESLAALTLAAFLPQTPIEPPRIAASVQVVHVDVM